MGEITELIGAHTIDASVAGGVFEDNGINIKADTVRRHRLNRCETCKQMGLSW